MQNYVLAFGYILYILQEISVSPFLLPVVRKLKFIPNYFCVFSNEAI